jgi:hypothetical protein
MHATRIVRIIQRAREQFSQGSIAVKYSLCADLGLRWLVRAYDVRFLSSLQCKNAGSEADAMQRATRPIMYVKYC